MSAEIRLLTTIFGKAFSRNRKFSRKRRFLVDLSEMRASGFYRFVASVDIHLFHDSVQMIFDGKLREVQL